MNKQKDSVQEFRYEIIDIKKQVVLATIFSVVWFLIILWSESPITSLVFFIITGMSVYRYFKFYIEQQSTTIKLDDICITYILGKEETKIRWDEVINSEVKGYGKENLNILVIEDKVRQIQIGTDIKEIHKIINFVKDKLGDKFDTTSIPLEYKFPQR